MKLTVMLTVKTDAEQAGKNAGENKGGGQWCKAGKEGGLRGWFRHADPS